MTSLTLNSLLLQSTGSRAHRLQFTAHRLSCPAACGIFPDHGSNPRPLHWQADSEQLKHQGGPTCYIFGKIVPYLFLPCEVAPFPLLLTVSNSLSPHSPFNSLHAGFVPGHHCKLFHFAKPSSRFTVLSSRRSGSFGVRRGVAIPMEPASTWPA